MLEPFLQTINVDILILITITFLNHQSPNIFHTYNRGPIILIIYTQLKQSKTVRLNFNLRQHFQKIIR